MIQIHNQTDIEIRVHHSQRVCKDKLLIRMTENLKFGVQIKSLEKVTTQKP